MGAYLVFEHLRPEIVAAHRLIADPYLDDIAAILAAGAVVGDYLEPICGVVVELDILVIIKYVFLHIGSGDLHGGGAYLLFAGGAAAQVRILSRSPGICRRSGLAAHGVKVDRAGRRAVVININRLRSVGIRAHIQHLEAGLVQRSALIGIAVVVGVLAGGNIEVIGLCE